MVVVNHAGGIAITAFIVAVAVSISYYQFTYIPEVRQRPTVPEEVLEPDEATEITVVEGSSNPENDRFFVPASIRATLGESNRVVWTSEDPVPHTVTTDDEYEDPYSGLFDSRERPQEEGGPFLMQGQTYEFLFTQLGEYPYHCEPHPWMQGTIEVVESFS